DYVQYRALLDSSVQQSYDQGPTNGQLKAVSIPLPAEVPPETPTSSPMPSLDEVLASFRTPSVDAGEEVGWPEEAEEPEPISFSHEQIAHLETLLSPAPISPSALETLAASTRPSTSHNELPVTPASH